MRKSLLQSSTSGTSSGVSGRCTDFIAIIDYANIPDTTGFTFEEHVNRESARVFELRNPIKSDVRFIGTEDLEDDDNEYCVAFFNRRTKQTEYKPVSLLRVVPQKRRKVEESGILEGRRRRQSINYSQREALTEEETREKRNDLIMEFGNTRRRKTLEMIQRRKIDSDIMNIINSNMVKTDAADPSTNDVKSDISLLETPESMVIPKMNMAAKSPDEVFKLEDFFLPEELDEFKSFAPKFFKSYPNLNKICELGVPKFVGIRVVEAYHRNELYAASALKLLLLSMVMPRGPKLMTNVDLKKLDIFPGQITNLIGLNFLRGKTTKEGKMVIEKRFKEKILSHMLALYLALSGSGNYKLPMSYLSSELQIGDVAAKSVLQNIGCLVQIATNEEKRTYNTVSIAHLVGPMKAGVHKRGRGGGSYRRR